MRSELRTQRELILETAYKSKCAAHLSPSLSIVEIVNVLFNYFIDIDYSKNFLFSNFILSKGHAALALYSLMASKKLITIEELFTYNKKNSRLGTHPSRHKSPGVEVSTGSLGHGLPIGIGIAYANKLNNSDKVIYILVGDGEMNEGSSWEAILIASKLSELNICLIIDNNGLYSENSNSTNNLSEKIKSFGWNTFECDGHNEEELKRAFDLSRFGLNAIIANTLKGKGFKAMEQDPEKWHCTQLYESIYLEFKKEIQNVR